jgi:FkbM family methyltransferase
MRKSSTNIGIIGFLEKIIRVHPLVYWVLRSLIRYTNIFEKDFDGLKKIYLKNNINIIDVGASDGLAVKFFLNNLSVNKVICFEPYKVYINILKKQKKVIVKPFAIGNSNIKTKIFFPRYKFFNRNLDLMTYAHYDHSLMQHFIKDFKFRSNLSIGSGYLKIKKIKKLSHKIDLIKIDTNGYELTVIKGLYNIINKDRPALIVEINKDREIIAKLLKNIGYFGCYYSVKLNKFTKKMDVNCTNKYFLQKKHLNYIK